MAISYKDAGVDVEKGDRFVNQIKKMVASTYTNRVVKGVGGFCALYDMGDRYLASGTDGVGTKLQLAQQLKNHQSIGIDLVAMCVNDIICCGAKPLFFLDYLACGKLDLKISQDVVQGIVEGCRQAGCALIGGETAEMPGLYQEGEYDLAGFAVGEVPKEQLLDGRRVQEGDYIFGLPSSGFHSNGFSLIRQLIRPKEKKLLESCLLPTRIYVQDILQALKKFPKAIKGLAHITGGGFDNIKRINNQFHYDISNFSFLDRSPDFMQEVCNRSGLSRAELLKTFNMGIGFVLIVSQEEVGECFDRAFLLGRVRRG